MNKKMNVVLMVLLLLSALLSGCGKTQPVTVEEKLVTVETGFAKKGDLILRTSLSGKIKPFEEAGIVPKTPGKVEKVNVEIGDLVKPGDILFELDQQDVLNGVKQGEAAYALSLANLNGTQERVDNAVANYERMKALYDQGAISKQQFEQYELQASETTLDIARSQVEQSMVSLENMKSKLDDCIVTSPISGVVTAVNINKGEMTSGGNDAVNIASLNKVIIETNVSEYLINKVHIGDEVDVSIKSAGETPFKGKITALSPSPAKNALTYPIKITIDNHESTIKPGMFAEIYIISDKRENIISIPSDAIVIKNGKQVVFLVQENKAILREISLGIDNGEMVEVTTGLKEGDTIVIKGQNYVEDGSKVNVIK